ncbi:MAG: hypothetical protein J6V36_02690, partial [Clostridia bacterium]|nr:hypothetical protein [Clostridia bacterium]
MKLRSKRIVALVLATVFVLGLIPTEAVKTVTAGSGLAAGTVVYYEDFNYPNDSTKKSVLSTLGWEVSTEQNANNTNYEIKDGRLYCDSISTSAAADSYVTVLDNEAMGEVAQGDYTITYKLTYAAATGHTRYGAMIYNYNGYKSYNSVHLRIAGFGNNEVRNANRWYAYDGGTLGAKDTSSVSYKLFGVKASTADASSNTNYPFVKKELTIRVAIDKDVGPTVYVNNVKVSTPNSKYKTLFDSSYEYAKAIGLIISNGVQLYIDDIMVYTGLGAAPTGVTKESVTYESPIPAADKNA